VSSIVALESVVDMSISIGFIVNGFVEGESGHFHVIGRCGDDPIRIGDIFDVIRPSSHSSLLAEGDAEGTRTIRLRVEHIQAYQRRLEELGSGMTGTIDLCGQGLEFVKPGSVLGSTSRPNASVEQSAAMPAESE
jgi:hypothetical protein